MNGLNRQELEYRINNGMVNNENIRNSRTTKSIILSNLLTLFNFIHVGLLVLVLTTGSIRNAAFMGSIIFNVIISIYQEIKAKIIIDKLKIGTKTLVHVLREGEIKEINPEEIVLDDILYIKQGDNLPVDAIIVESDNLEVDEGIITGESEAILKEKDDKVISGSIVIAGTGYAKVTSINRDTYANHLIKEASQQKDNTSYLMTSINSILKVVTSLIIPVGLMLFISQFFYSGQSYTESVLSSVAGVIGMIPDGLVLLTSISLTVGVIKMASKKVIIQKLSGIELLACVDILCLDKTGTITDGSMSVIDVVPIDKKIDVKEIIPAMIDSDGNATDKAMRIYFKNESNLKVVRRVPFASSRKYSLTEFEKGTYAIGALEYLTNQKIDEFPVLNEYLDKGYRIITLVECKKDFNLKTNRVVAFIIIKDNIRNNAKETLDYFKKQNVDIKIISGDNPITVSNLLKQLEIENYDKYISGNDLPNDYEALRSMVDDYVIFGRVTPEQKKMIVKALKEYNMVGYIGDGVNDILALKESDCGIALASGISAARSVAEVVLTDSDFSILPHIVNEGRRVVNNIERVASMYLIKTVYSFLIAITCIMFNHEYPFYPIQLSLISAICVGIPSFFLAIEPNYAKVEKGFLIKVFRNALPSAICVWLNIIFLMINAYIFKWDFDIFRITIVASTGFLSLRMLYNISMPLTTLRKLLVYSCFLAFYLGLGIFNKFFLVNNINIWSVVYLILLIIADVYVSGFFEMLYDKYIKKPKRKSRRGKREKVKKD